MRNCYVGDVGDFGKFALLRALGHYRRIGVIWYQTTESISRKKTNDGKYLDYLDRPERFQTLDRPLFNGLRLFRDKFKIEKGARSLEQLEACRFLEGAVYFSEKVPVTRELREKWMTRILESEILRSDLLFLDPDNGIARSQITPKHVSLEEIAKLKRLKKPIMIYHHQTRVKGGAVVEADWLATKMRSLGCKRVQIVRLRPYSSRFYVIADHNAQLSQRLLEFAERWRGMIEVFDR